MKTKSFCDELEKMLDESTLQAVLEDLAKVCRDKADHVQENWQDERLAKLWEVAACQIDNVGEWTQHAAHPSFARKLNS